MDINHMTSAGFWKGQGHFIAAECSGGLPHLEGCRGSVVFRTSGTTGEGKWIVLEKESMLVSARAVNEWLDVVPESRWGLALPTNHVGGFSIFARCFEAGCGLSVFERKWNAFEFTEWISNEGVSHTSLVPTQVHDLVAGGIQAPSSLKALVVGGGRLSPESGQAARDLGWPVLASYGMTEAGSQIATQPLASLEQSFSACQMAVLPIWEVRVSEENLLEIRGDALFAGKIEEGRYHPRESEWFKTSDRVEVIGNTLVPLGRADSLVKIMGELVDLEKAERKFSELAGNRMETGRFALVAVPDARKEHKLVVVFEGADVSDLIEEYNRSVSGVERIEESIVVDEFPRSSLGKLNRWKLTRVVTDIDH